MENRKRFGTSRSGAAGAKTWVHAAVGRTGLGNMLFSWARAEVFSHALSLPMLAPQWVKPKVGPLLRGERDLRYYTSSFSSDGYVTGFNRLAILLFSKRINGEATDFGTFQSRGPTAWGSSCAGIARRWWQARSCWSS